MMLLNNLLDHSSKFISQEGLQIEKNSLILSLEQNLMMICEIIGREEDESTEISQKSILIIVKYIIKLQKGLPDLVNDQQMKLVELLLSNLQKFVETNKTIYIRFFEVAVNIAIVNE